MASNASVQRFKKLTVDLQAEVHAQAVAELNNQAQQLASLIEAVAPEHEGVLKTTVKVVPGQNDTTVRIVAGGQQTIRQNGSSKPYDYARADEFGTQKMPARPFFFPTYRLRKKAMRAAMKRKITASIKKRSAL